jgi:hypothetical protein
MLFGYVKLIKKLWSPTTLGSKSKITLINFILAIISIIDFSVIPSNNGFGIHTIGDTLV